MVIKDTAKLYSPGELNDACEIKARVLIQRFVNCTPKLKDVLILEPILSDWHECYNNIYFPVSFYPGQGGNIGFSFYSGGSSRAAVMSV